MTKSKLSNKESFGTVFSEEGLEFCITQIEEAIIKLKSSLAEKYPSFKEAEEMYLNEKREIGIIETDIEKKSKWLEDLVSNRGGNLGKTDIRIIRTTSHNADKHKKDIQARESWLTPAVEILESEKRFLNAEVLFELILKSNPNLNKKYQEGNHNSIKVRVIANLIRSAELDPKRGIKKLGIYKNKLGLYKWMVKDKPLDSFLKDFLFKPDDVAA